MVLASDVRDLWRLVKEAKDDRKPFDESFRKLEDTFVSRWFGTGGDRKGASQPENVPFSFASLMLPHMVQNSPRFLAKADGTYENEVFAAGSQAALNLIARRSAWHRTLRPAAFDYLMSYPAMFIEMTPSKHASVPDSMRRRIKGALRSVPQEDHESPVHQSAPMSPAPPHWPALRHVRRDRWGWDMKATAWDEARFLWTETTYDIDDLEVMAEREPKKWKIAEIRRLKSSMNDDELGYGGARFGGSAGRVEDRNQVTVYQVWVPEAELPGAGPSRGEKGVYYTFAVYSSAESGDVPIELARPFYFYGPPSGPLVTGGQFTVSMESVPLNLLIANKEQIDLMNGVMYAISQRIKNHKRVWAYDMAVDDDIRAVAKRADGQLQGVQGLIRDGQQSIIPMDFGGVDQSDIAHIQVVQDALARNIIGADETIRGNVGSGATATEASLAFSEVRSRIEYILEGWDQVVLDAGNAVRWYVENDTRFFTQMDAEGKGLIRGKQAQRLVDMGVLGPEQAKEALDRAKGQPLPWQGGDLALDDAGQIDPHAIEVEVEAFSMGRRTGAQRRAEEVALNEQLSLLGQAMVAMPHVNWKQRIKRLGEVFGQPGLEELVDEQVASQIAGIQLQGAMPDVEIEGYGSGGGGGEPTLRPVQGFNQPRPTPQAAAAQEGM